MGVDCTMYLYNREIDKISDEFLGGLRNSEWFDQMGNGAPGLHIVRLESPEELPEILQPIIARWEGSFYNLRKISALDYLNWVAEYKPYLDAGWCTKREAWEYRTRGIIPYLQYELDEDDIIEDREFLEVCYNGDINLWFKEELLKRNMKLEEIDIYYWFDC